MSQSEAAHGHDHGHTNYVKVWGVLVVLLVVSIIGPELGNPIITLITAFGIAFVKAYLVVMKFMHLDREPKFVSSFVIVCLAFMALMFAGIAPDVMRHDGANWENVAAKKVVQDAAAAHGEGDHGHGEAH